MTPAGRKKRRLSKESREQLEEIQREDMEFHRELDRKPTGRVPSLWPRLDLPDEVR